MDDKVDPGTESAPGGTGPAPQTRPGPPERQVRDGARPTADSNLRAMLRQVHSSGGAARLVSWMARQINGHVVMCDSLGRPVHASPEYPEDLRTQIAADVKRVAAGDALAASVDLGRWSACILALHEAQPQGLLIVAREHPLTSADRSLAADGARLLWLRSRVEEADIRQQRLDAADGFNREAILHLLMVGHVSGARRAAAALRPAIPDVVRLHIVECPSELRDEGVRRCEEASQGRAWIVRCPVYHRHIIVLSPADSSPGADPSPGASSGSGSEHDASAAARGPTESALLALAATEKTFFVGTSHTTGLRGVPTAYGQAFHALAVARHMDHRHARFTDQGSLSTLLRQPGRAWARRTLQPLLDHRPRRKQDPDSPELLITLTSWLNFYGGAARQLKIHRNTLTARLRRIEALLRCDLSDIAAQAATHLALQLLDQPVEQAAASQRDTTLDAMLEREEVREWAQIRLSALLQPAHADQLSTLRVWLAANAHAETAAQQLGISPPGVRRRLARIEDLTERSLLNGPSARYDMWFALRAYDGSTHSAAP
ncbi:MAG: helix-turn-helix domain-containing protein [Micromonosporaceae bacterium]